METTPVEPCAQLSRACSVLLRAACAFLLGGVACSEPAPSAPQPSVPVPSAAPPAAATTSAPAPRKSPAIQEQAARALVEAWLAAQNAGDFAAYEKLYAARFTGIKRAADRVKVFDRAGWLADRKGMFARGFRVMGDSITVRSLGASAVVTLEQSFRSENFSDRGPKQLVLAREGDALHIAREEMLRSELTPRLSAKALSDSEFAFVRTIDERRFWLSSADPEGQELASDPQLIRHGAAFGNLSVDKLPASLKALAGTSVVLDGSDQPGCEVKLENWGVLADFNPHFGDDRRWGGLDGEPPLPEAEIAREIFGPNKVTGADHRFAVDITEASRACAAPRWARAKALPRVPVYALEELVGEALEATRPLLRKSPDYKQLQKTFAEEGGRAAWDTATNAGLAGHACRIGASRFVLASLRHWEDCQSFSGEMTALGREEAGALRAMPAALPAAFTPELALDLDGDGVPEWVSEFSLLGWDGKTYSIVLSVEPSDYDCPC